jgi:putative phosphonate metabolism protein
MSAWRRHAIYFAPPRGSPLARFGADWLGWKPESGTARDGLAIRGLPRPWEALVAAPQRYGFHATLKPPFRLAAGHDVAALDAAVAALAAGREAFEVPRLGVALIDGFVALVPEGAAPALAALADACVVGLDGFRAPVEPEELARRRAAGLDAAEEANLITWGYPYVLDRFRFHMTLTGWLEPADREPARTALAAALGPILGVPLPVTEICRFSEAADGRFRLVRRFPLG